MNHAHAQAAILKKRAAALLPKASRVGAARKKS
jgi:hypothetical protein